MSQHNNLPSLRFSEFEKAWNEFKLKGLFKISAGGDINKENVSQERNDIFKYPIYANAKAKKGLYGYSDIFKFEGSSLTIAGRGAYIGIAHARNESFYPIVRLLVLKPLNEDSEDLKFYEYQFNRKDILVESTGVPQLTAPQVGSYKVLKPQLSEQQKIASFLTAVDTKIEQLTKKKSLLEQYKKGVMQKIFPSTDGRAQEIRFKDENGNDYPDWEHKKIGKVGNFYYGKSAPKWSVTEDAKTPCIRYGELYTKSSLVIDKIHSYTNIDPKNLKFSKGGEVLVPRVGEDPRDFSKCHFLPFKNVAIGEMISVFNTNENGIFITYYFNTLKTEFARLVEGGNVSNLYFRYLEDITIGIPCLKEQSQIADFLSAIDDKIKLVGKQLENTQQFKKGLLQKMFV